MTLSDHAEAVHQTGAEETVPVVDLNASSLKFYGALGPENSKLAFVHFPANTFPNPTAALRDDTHHSSYGAYESARIVATGIRESKLDLARFSSDDFETFDAAKPDEVDSLGLPPSPAEAAIEPEGNESRASMTTGAKQSRIVASRRPNFIQFPLLYD